jgi:hypothetical protein
VAHDSHFIAASLGWPEDEINIAEAVGVLHDVGRFSQYVEFGTFHDPDSINHGKRGHEVARTCSPLMSADDDISRVVLDSIRYHNCRHLPSGLPDDSVRYLKLIRDADKIDIIYVVNHAIANKLHEKYPQIMLDIDLDGGLTPALIEEVEETGTGTYNNVNTLADLNLMRLTWISNINYDPSLKVFSERNLMQELVECIPSDDRVDKLTAGFMTQLNDRLEKCS